MSAETASAMLRSWLCTMTANSQSSARRVAEGGRGVVERQDGVADDEHALAGGGAHGVVGEADGAVDAVERRSPKVRPPAARAAPT